MYTSRPFVAQVAAFDDFCNRSWLFNDFCAFFHSIFCCISHSWSSICSISIISLSVLAPMEADLLVLITLLFVLLDFRAVDNAGSGHAKRGTITAPGCGFMFLTSWSSLSFNTGYFTCVVPLRSITGRSVDARERAVKWERLFNNPPVLASAGCRNAIVYFYNISIWFTFVLNLVLFYRIYI